MKTRTTKHLLLSSSMAFVVRIPVYTSASSWAAEPAERKEVKMESKMTDKCGEMKKEKRKMKAQDVELTATVATMNKAAQDKKIDLVASIVAQLVEQRAAMHVQSEKMEEESVSTCPMIKSMQDLPDDAHTEHHKKSA